MKIADCGLRIADRSLRDAFLRCFAASRFKSTRMNDEGAKNVARFGAVGFWDWGRLR
jgi:hypothetical protein